MAPLLRVFAGTSPETMTPINSVVNTQHSHKLFSDLFEGEVVVNIKGLTDDSGEIKDSEYFNRPDRHDITWSLQVRGRFLTPHSADDILFGNTFDRPLGLPWGSGAALKFMHYIDPTLVHDLQSPTKPWALSPLVSTMPHFMHTRVPVADTPSDDCSEFLAAPPATTTRHKNGMAKLPPFPPAASITDDTSQLHLAMMDSHSSSGSTSDEASSSKSSISSTLAATAAHSYTDTANTSPKVRAKRGMSRLRDASKNALKPRRSKSASPHPGLGLETASQRQAYFSSSEHRQAIRFGPEDVITTDFCYGFLEFNPTLALRIPGGLSFDLMRYWDGQPVRFVCCERKHDTGDGGEPWGTIFWCISIEMGGDE